MARKLEVERKLLFQCPNTLVSWSAQMLLAIDTAKRLGYTNLEIDTVTRLRTRPVKEKADPRARPNFYDAFASWHHHEIEGEEWKAQQTDQPTVTVEEVLVKLWATRLVDVAEEPT